MCHTLKELSENLLKKAKYLGATSAEALATKNKSLSIEVKNQKLEKIEKIRKKNRLIYSGKNRQLRRNAPLR